MQQFRVGSLGRMIPADTTGFVPSSRPRAAAIHGAPADHVLSGLAGWEPPMRRTTSMQRIGLRNLFVTGAMVLMLATGANANIFTLSATLTGGQETPANSSGGTGSAAIVLDDVAMTLTTEEATFSGLTSGVILGHIHAAPPGVAGPVVHPYNVSSVMGQTSGTFAVGDVWSAASSPALTPALVADIEAGNA